MWINPYLVINVSIFYVIWKWYRYAVNVVYWKKISQCKSWELCFILLTKLRISSGVSRSAISKRLLWRGKDCCCSVALSCPTLCDPMNCSTPVFLVLHCLPEFAQTHVRWVSVAVQPSLLCCPLLFLPSIFPSIRDFSNELALCIKRPKYWSFSFSISPTDDYSWLISFRINWFDLLPVQWTLREVPGYIGVFVTETR